MESEFKEKYKKEELKKMGVITSLKKIDESKIDLTIRPAEKTAAKPPIPTAYARRPCVS